MRLEQYFLSDIVGIIAGCNVRQRPALEPWQQCVRQPVEGPGLTQLRRSHQSLQVAVSRLRICFHRLWDVTATSAVYP